MGSISAAGKAHQQAAEAKMAGLMQLEDNEELLALDKKYSGMRFYDKYYHEYRHIEKIEWNGRCKDQKGNPAPSRFEAVTVKVYEPSHKHAGQRMKTANARREQPYGLLPPVEIEGMDAMVVAYTARVEAHAQKMRERTRKEKEQKKREPKANQKRKKKKRGKGGAQAAETTGRPHTRQRKRQRQNAPEWSARALWVVV